MEEVSKAATEKAVGSGALRETVSIAEIDDIPLPVSYPTFGMWKSYHSHVLIVHSKQIPDHRQSYRRF